VCWWQFSGLLPVHTVVRSLLELPRPSEKTAIAAFAALLKREGIQPPSEDFSGLFKRILSSLNAAAQSVAFLEAQRSLVFHNHMRAADPRSRLLFDHGRDILQSIGASVLLASILLDKLFEIAQEEFTQCTKLGEDLDTGNTELLVRLHAAVAKLRRAVHSEWQERQNTNLSADIRLRDDRLADLLNALPTYQEHCNQANFQATRVSNYLQAIKAALFLFHIVEASTRAVRRRYEPFAPHALATYKHPLLRSSTDALVPGSGQAPGSGRSPIPQACVRDRLTVSGPVPGPALGAGAAGWMDSLW
jgi:hypothetical protein